MGASETSLVMIGALAHIDLAKREALRAHLDALEGIETFDVSGCERIGVLVEGRSIEEAHARLQSLVAAADGVLGVWPISLETDGTMEGAAEGLRGNLSGRNNASWEV